MAVDIIRHGDRAPIATVPKSPTLLDADIGQLTPEGMQQEYQLGVSMHKKYIDQYHLLSPQYAHENVYVRSTNIDRTLMSAESLLFGLYPLGSGPQTLPSNFQPIPIHTVKKEEDTLLIPDQDPKKTDALLVKYVYNQPNWIKKTAALQEKLKYWNQVTGMPMHSLRDVVPLADNLFVRKHYNIAMPSGISADEANQIIDTGMWAFVEMLKPNEIGKATMGPLLAKISDYLQDAANDKSKLKFVLFSAHDSTIMAVMSALSAPVDKQPHYASNLNFALYETASNQYYVKVTLNDEPVVIPACQGAVCTLSQFADLVKKMQQSN